MNRKLLLVATVFALGFISCPAIPPMGLMGTLIAPAGTDVNGTIVVACNVVTCAASPQGNADVITVTQTGLTAQWFIPLTTAGKYRVFAVNAQQGLTGIYKNLTNNSNVVELVMNQPGENLNITINLEKAVVPARALDLLNTTVANP